jgi:CheY-like chemotaxis protein/nitrogen-specific signal transduction histidine kinase
MAEKGNVVTKDQTQRDKKTPDSPVSHSELLNQIADREAKLLIKSRLIDTTAYQIRTLSNAVIGFSDLLLSEDITQSQSEYVQEISHAGYGLSALVSEVLDWAQVLSGKLEIQKTNCELSEIIQRLEQILSLAARDKEIDYQIVTDPMLPALIFSDDERLLRCLLNLIANTIRYTPQGSVRIHVLLEEGVLGPVIRFDIVDSGVGIDAERVAHLFEPHNYQVGSEPKLFTQLDMGLHVMAGLPLTKLLIEFLGGTIEVQSQVGVGSTFSLRIPVGKETTEQPLKNLPAENGWQPTDTPVGPVLLVEDQPANRTVISLMLEALGAEVETAADGEEALRKVEQNSYSLILMDLKMPKMDGYEATRRLREKDIEIPIVALSAKVMNGDEHRRIAAMFNGFLTKPVDSKKLSEMLHPFIKGFTANCPGEQDTVALEYGN